MIYYGKLKRQPEDLAKYIEIKNDWMFATFGNPCLLTKHDIPKCEPLKHINEAAYRVLVATLNYASPFMYYDEQRPISWRPEGEV